MKVIMSKLFFAIFIVALFIVGLKIDVKAANNLEYKIENGSGDSKDWNDNDARLVWYFTVDTDDCEVTEREFTFEWDNTPAVTTNDIKMSFKTQKDGTDYKIDGTIQTLPYKIKIAEVTKENIKSASTGGVVKIALKEKIAGTEIKTVEDEVGVYKITPKATYNGEDITTVPVITLSPNAAQKVLPGEKVTFKVTNNVSAGVKYDSWSLEGTGSITPTTVDSKPACEVVIPGTSVSYDKTLIVNYIDNPDVKLTFSKELTNAILTNSKSIDERTFTFEGGYTGSDIDTITIDGKAVSGLAKSSGNPGNIVFTVPSATDVAPSKTTKKLIVNMKDGRKFERDVYVIDPTTTVEVSLNKTSPQTIGVGETLQFTPSIDPAISGATFTYKYSDGYTTYVTPTQSGNALNLLGKAVTPTGSPVNVKATASFKVEGLGSKSTVDSTGVDVNVTTPTFTLSDVYVNEELTIPLSPFAGGDYVGITSITKSPSNLSISKSTGTVLAKYVTIKGSSATKTISNALTIDGQTANVTVYPKPAITSMDKSGSGSSLKYTFKVTMPAKGYHGSIVNSDINKAKIQFVGKDGTYTMDAFELSDDTSGYTKKNKSDVTIDIKKLREVLSDICKEDKETVKISVYADGDKDIISDEKELKVYKITLDGSGGADYKIMGESVSDRFYAIDGVTYEISTTPKSGYLSTIDKWEGTSFGTNTSGSTSFSESKTIKAIYKSGSSSSSSSSKNSGAAGDLNLDDYDDVPKTGESKADIWILWSVLFLSILGAGFMVWKRFGLVRAIADADEEMAIAEHEEQVKAEKKAKDDKMKMLKDLRNL